MSAVQDPWDVGKWEQSLGLLPVPLYDRSRPSYALMNGSRGNFCLDFEAKEAGPSTRSAAWSADVGHYIVVVGNRLEVQRWDTGSPVIERYDAESVYSNIEAFHAYIESTAPGRENSVIAHATRVFRSVRAALGTGIEGEQALQAFLCLLASCTDKVSLDELALNKWALTEADRDIAGQVAASNWQALANELTTATWAPNLTPDLELVLRHACGQLFQEAHYQVLLDSRQLALPGFLPLPSNVLKRAKEIGLHFTPAALVRTLTEEALRLVDLKMSSITVFDPACGSGEFLREALRQLQLQQYTGRVDLIGWDLSAAACQMARFALAWEVRGREDNTHVDIRCCDSLLAENWPSHVDMILTNPPFLSWQDMKPARKETVRQVLGTLTQGRPDLSHPFLLKSAECLREGGVLAAVVPASTFDSSSAAKLREHLGDQLSPHLLARLGSHVLFVNATVDVGLYVGRKEQPLRSSALNVWADYRPASAAACLRGLRRLRRLEDVYPLPIEEDGFSIYQRTEDEGGAKSWAPRPYKAWQLQRQLSGMTKVHDLFDVRQGARTGRNETLLLSREQWLQLPSCERCFFRPAVRNKSIYFGVLTDVEYVFYPYNQYSFETEDALSHALPTYYNEYLLPDKNRLMARSRITPTSWWLLSEHRRWQEGRHSKLVSTTASSTTFGTAGSFSWDSTGDYAVVQGLAWIPKSGGTLTHELGMAYAALLNSDVFFELVSSRSNPVRGGQWELARRFVGKLPLPDLNSRTFDHTVVVKLTQIGRKLIRAEAVDEELWQEIARMAYGVGLSNEGLI